MKQGYLQSSPGVDPIIVEGMFRAPLSHVYRAWTEPDRVVKWFGRSPGGIVSAEIDLRVGGRWRFEMPEENGRSFLQGEYLEIEKDVCLVFTWCHVVEHDDGSHDTTPVSKVIVRFEAEGAATRIMLRHEGIVREEGRTGVGKGWDECLINLNAYVELTA